MTSETPENDSRAVGSAETPSRLIFEHRCSTKVEGRRALNLFLPLALCFLAIGTVLIYSGEIPVFSWIWTAMTFGVCVWGIFGFVLPNMRMDKYFTLRVFADHIECESPAPRFGPSYGVALENIRLLECDRRDDSERWSMVTFAGDVLEITSDYRNPVDRIVHHVRQACPQVKVLEITRQNRKLKHRPTKQPAATSPVPVARG